MALPLLAPLIGGMIGTAAAPALGIGTAMAAGLGSGIASLAAGADPEEALFAGLTGGIGSKILPGILGTAGKGGEAAAAAAAQGAGQAAAQGAGQAAAQGAGQAAAQGMSTQDLIKLASRAIPSGGAGAPAPQAAPTSGPAGGPPPSNGGVSIPQMVQGNSINPFGSAPQTVAPVTSTSEALTPPPVQVQPLDNDARPSSFGGIGAFGGEELQNQGLTGYPNLGNANVAYPLASYARGGFAKGGFVEGPGTGTSDDIPATIYQDGEPVQEAALSDGEFVMTADAVKGAGDGDRNKGAAEMYRMMRQFEERAA